MNFIVDNSNLNDFNRKMKTGNMIVWYFAPWCGHCKMMEPEWNKFMAFKNNHPVLSKKLNCARVSDSILPHLNDKYRSITGFPTIKFYKNGNPQGEFESHIPRTSENFKEFTMNNLSNDSLSSNSDSLSSNSDNVDLSESNNNQPMRKKRKLGSKKKRGSKKGRASRRRRSRGSRSRRR